MRPSTRTSGLHLVPRPTVLVKELRPVVPRPRLTPSGRQTTPRARVTLLTSGRQLARELPLHLTATLLRSPKRWAVRRRVAGPELYRARGRAAPFRRLHPATRLNLETWPAIAMEGTVVRTRSTPPEQWLRTSPHVATLTSQAATQKSVL